MLPGAIWEVLVYLRNHTSCLHNCMHTNWGVIMFFKLNYITGPIIYFFCLKWNGSIGEQEYPKNDFIMHSGVCWLEVPAVTVRTASNLNEHFSCWRAGILWMLIQRIIYLQPAVYMIVFSKLNCTSCMLPLGGEILRPWDFLWIKSTKIHFRKTSMETLLFTQLHREGVWTYSSISLMRETATLHV